MKNIPIRVLIAAGAILALGLVIAFPSLEKISMLFAYAILAMFCAACVFVAYWVGGHSHYSVMDRRDEHRALRQQRQAALTLSSLPATKVTVQEQERKALPTHRTHRRNTVIPIPGNGREQGGEPFRATPASAWATGYRPPTTAVGNAVPTGMIVFGEPFQARSRTFSRDEQEHVVSLAREGKPVREILATFRIGNDYSTTITAIIEAYKSQVGSL